FYPVRRMLERAAGIDHDDQPAIRRARLAAFCAAKSLFVGSDALGSLAALLGVPPDAGAPVIELAPEQLRTRMIGLLLGYLNGLAAARPTLLVVEDLHWSDPSTIELLCQLIEQGPCPQMLLLITSRPPTALPVFRGQVLQLEPLTDDDIGLLIDQLEIDI